MPTSSCVSENVALLEEDERPGNNQKKLLGKSLLWHSNLQPCLRQLIVSCLIDMHDHQNKSLNHFTEKKVNIYRMVSSFKCILLFSAKKKEQPTRFYSFICKTKLC